MTVSLNRAYGAYPAGAVVSLPASTEAAIIAQNIGTASAALPTAGNMTSNEFQGDVVAAAAAASVVVTNPNVTPGSNITAYVTQAAADGTALRVERVVPALGSFTIYLTAAATAATRIHWSVLSTGETPNQ